MTPGIDVVLDSEDELATTQAIHRLAAAEPGVLAVRIAPDARTTPALIWAILRPLGKRLGNLAGEVPTSRMAQTWLKAHQITELVVLHAQHLTPARHDELSHLIERIAITATLIYTGHGATGRHATTTLATLLARPRRSCPSEARAAPWPELPASHPLRLRHDCRLALSEDELRRVDGLLFASYNILERWLLAHPRATDEQLHRAVDVMRIAHDPSQRCIRDCAITAALNSALPILRALNPHHPGSVLGSPRWPTATTTTPARHHNPSSRQPAKRRDNQRRGQSRHPHARPPPIRRCPRDPASRPTPDRRTARQPHRRTQPQRLPRQPHRALQHLPAPPIRALTNE
jgi:hypothetical protein